MKEIKIKNAYENMTKFYDYLGLYWGCTVPDNLKKWTKTAQDPNYVSKAFDTNLGKRRIELWKSKISWFKHCINITYSIPRKQLDDISQTLFYIKVSQDNIVTISGVCTMTPKQIYLALYEINQIMNNYFDKCRECTNLVAGGF